MHITPLNLDISPVFMSTGWRGFFDIFGESGRR